MNLAETLASHAACRGDVPALCEGDVTVRYAAFWERVRRAAHGFRLAGVQPGDRLILLATNRIEGFETVFAAALAGIVCVPLNHRLAADEIAAIVRDCGPSLAIADEPLLGLLPRTMRALSFSGDRYREPSEYERLLANSSPHAITRVEVGEPHRIAQIKYTSGTTGEPKGVLISHSARVAGFLYRTVDFGFRPDDTFLLPGPLYGGFGTLTMLALHLGATVMLAREFSAPRIVETIESGEPSICLLVPTMYERIFADCQLRAERLSNLRMVLSATGPLHARTRIEILKEFGPILHEFYGTTEAGVLTHARPDDHQLRPGTVGRALLGTQLRIVDESGADRPDIGELCVAGPDMFEGYLGREDATAADLRGGWYHTGDIARIDDQGYVFLVDRKKQTVISGGQNIYPLEIERLLFEHPDVQEAAVLGVDDRIWGEILVAAVVRKPGALLTSEQVIAYCGSRLAGFKKPKLVRFVPQLPRDSGGKVQRRHLRSLFTDSATPPSD